jgi:hypothetical protein
MLLTLGATLDKGAFCVDTIFDGILRQPHVGKIFREVRVL